MTEAIVGVLVIVVVVIALPFAIATWLFLYDEWKARKDGRHH